MVIFGNEKDMHDNKRLIPNVTDIPSHEREPKETLPEAPPNPSDDEEEDDNSRPAFGLRGNYKC
jgi:hypothetical protein